MTQSQVNRIARRFEPRMVDIVALVLREEKVQKPVRPVPKDNMDRFLMGRKLA